MFNKNNVKLSFSCMPNMQSVINAHNFKVLKRKDNPEKKMCNCRKQTCPLNGKCCIDNLIYRATVKTNESEKTYIGCSEGPFKARLANHTKSFTHKKYKNETKLSQYIWSLKEKNKQFTLSWEIAAKASPYVCGSRKCDLCLTEKLYISKADPEKSLISRAEIISTCRHRKKFTLQQT